jgi:hypothetical protein
VEKVGYAVIPASDGKLGIGLAAAVQDIFAPK